MKAWEILRRLADRQQFLARFADDDPRLIENMRRALAESCWGVGEERRADELFRTWLDANPRWSWGWIGWADCYALAPANRCDLDRAERILREGLAVEGLEGKDVFCERLEHVFEQQGRQDKLAELMAAENAQAKAASTPVRREAAKVGRNDPCPCGSGKKFKKCCGR